MGQGDKECWRVGGFGGVGVLMGGVRWIGFEKGESGNGRVGGYS